MFIDITNNNGTRYIRLAESIRVVKKGKSGTRKKIIKNVGPVSRYDDGEPDFEQRLKKSFISGEPIIPSLREFVSKKQKYDVYNFRITEHSPECIGHTKLFSHAIIERLLDELGILNVVRSYKCSSKIEYDVMGFLRLLIYGRILNPASKIATLSQNNDYFEQILSGDYYDYNIYDALSFVYQHKKQIFNRINKHIVEQYHRNPNIIFYDVTNFYFEIPYQDENIYDENGEVIEWGLRRNGVSKEHRKQPIVQMGMFMDDMGIPISFGMFPGTTLDHLTVRGSLSESVNNMNFGRFIFIGDRGMCNYMNLAHVLEQGNGYIVSKSIKKSKDFEREWIFDESDYIVVSKNFRYKSRISTRTIKDENNVKRKITEKVVVYWDRKFYNRQIKENKSIDDLLDKLMNNPHGTRISTTQAKDIKPFLKDEYENVKTGETVAYDELRAAIDPEKVAEARRMYGYYQIISSELEMSEHDIIEAYHGLTRIEDQFRVMKGVLNTRPIFVRTPEHIEAHLAICTIALIIIRLIQLHITWKNPNLHSKNFKDWSFGLPAERIQKALNKWTVDEFPDEYYRFNNLDDPDLKMIIDAFNIDIPLKLFRKQDLRKLKKKIASRPPKKRQVVT